ncbi:MAG: ATP-binding cassette domain-containing protein [Bacteroidota bacterium]|nr:ATP-binding cassette domain-containing protein [Bacteroidota bacterium]
MSEEILKALMQLFAIIAKQDEGASANERKYVEFFLSSQLNEELVVEYLSLYDNYLDKDPESKGKKLTSVKDSVRTLGICRKINKTLEQKQKIIVLLRLFELVNTDRSFTPQRMAIIDTVSEVFNISSEEFTSIKKFVIENSEDLLSLNDILIIDNNEKGTRYSNCKHIRTSQLDKCIIILKVKSVDLYFIRYTGESDIYLNGLPVNPKRMYILASGSTLKLPSGPLFYSDIVSKYLSDITSQKLLFKADNISYKFSETEYGLRNISITEGAGKLVGIMGSSGAGKTTLLNVLSGINKPSSGIVTINGINVHSGEIKGIIGYIPQDDLLIEELTVYENLYYNAKLCFKNATDEEVADKVIKVLDELGLKEIKDIRVGNPLNKKISGGQRKRLNIALEIIREPHVLFVDEPTSGLSSRDSENVMDLLRELALKGNLIFVVIHQPSSEIYKMFDNIIFLDTGGYLIYYGNPIEAVIYFKKCDNQANWETGECKICGNVNSEIIFNIIEAKVVDEFGKFTDKRKISPKQWYHSYKNQQKSDSIPETNEKLPEAFKIPGWFKQFKIFFKRDVLSKLSNLQYIIINSLESPLLGFILSFIIYYIANKKSNTYLFRENENMPAFIFISVIVALFVGLTVSAEEIFRDRKILKREKFLNLSRSSYLFSKIAILFSLSALQTLAYVLISNSIFGVKGMYFEYWLVLFSVSCFANMLGLNISASFNSAVTIYILIPLLIIPQLILGGAMFNFDKLNKIIGGRNKVPIVADLMTSRWAYEALVVNQYKNNKYEKKFYNIDKQESISNFKQVYYVPELKKIAEKCEEIIEKNNIDAEKKVILANDLNLLKNELSIETKNVKSISFEYLNDLNIKNFNKDIAEYTINYLDNLKEYYTIAFNAITDKKYEILDLMQSTPERKALFNKIKNDYFNTSLDDLVKRIYEKNQIIEENGRYIQVIDPIFNDPEVHHYLNFRTHFYAPRKYFMGNFYETLYFNVFIIWVMIIVLYFTLYYNVLLNFLNFFEKFKTIRKSF